MDEPSVPRMMPVAGWYLDPEVPDTWRYWDGARWTLHRAPAGPLPKADPHSFSRWFEQSVAAVGRVLWPVGVIVFVAALLVTAPLVVFVAWAAESTDGREIRDLLSTDADGTVSLTDAEVDRLWELVGDLAWSAVPVLALTVVAGAIVAAWTYSLVVHAAIDARSGRDAAPRSLGHRMSVAVRRAPVVIACFAVLSLLFGAVTVVLLAPMLAVIVADAGGAAIAVSAVFGALATLVVLAVLGVRLSLALVVAAAGGHGLGIRRSWQLTDGRFWAVLVRGLVAGLIAGAIGSALSFVVGFAVVLGVTAFIAVNLVLQAVSNAVSTVVVVPSQVVLRDHLEERSDR